MRYAMLLSVLLCAGALAQTTQPTTMPANPDRSTPIGMCMVFDRTIADLGIDKGMDFYHCETAAERRYARAELEFYVAVNRMCRAIEAKHGKQVAHDMRLLARDNDDYSDAVVNEEGDSAAMQRGDQQPFPLIRKDGKWRFSMPDWFEIMGAETLTASRLYYEARADELDAVRADVESGKLTTPQDIEARLGSASLRDE